MGKNAEAMDSLTHVLHMNSDVPDTEFIIPFQRVTSRFGQNRFAVHPGEISKDREKDCELIEAAELNLVKATFLHNAGRLKRPGKFL